MRFQTENSRNEERWFALRLYAMAGVALCAAGMVLFPLLMAAPEFTRAKLLEASLDTIEENVDVESLGVTTQMEVSRADDVPVAELTPRVTTCPDGWTMQAGGTCAPPPPPQPKVSGPGVVVDCDHGSCRERMVINGQIQN